MINIPSGVDESAFLFLNRVFKTTTSPGAALNSFSDFPTRPISTSGLARAVTSMLMVKIGPNGNPSLLSFN